MNATRSHARIKIVSQTLTPEDITNLMRLSPDRVRCAGEARPHTIIIENTNCWELDSGLPDHHELPEHIDSVLRRIEVCASQLVALAETGTIEVLLSCIVHASTEPSLSLSKSAIKALARICAEVDFDLYIGEDDE
jgi:Domain of unknown function (DUF4279)